MDKEKILFIDNHLNLSYHDDGFVILKDFCAEVEIQQLVQIYDDNYLTIDGMYVTHTTNDLKKNKSVAEQIFGVLKHNIRKHFRDYKEILAHFAVKKSYGDNYFKLHQDYSIVDESKYGIAHIWIALNDVNVDNGALMLVPGSHNLFNNYRSGTFGVNFISSDEIQNHITSFNLIKGDAVVYHPAIFHGSPNNNTSKDRIAVIAAITNISSEICYFQKNANEIEVYELTEQDIFSRLPELAQGQIPKGKLLRKENKKAELNERNILDCILNKKDIQTT